MCSTQEKHVQHIDKCIPKNSNYVDIVAIMQQSNRVSEYDKQLYLELLKYIYINSRN